jgi:predicted nucleotidyltransferase
MLTQENIVATLRDLMPVLRRDYAVRRIGLFGSFASGGSADDSDIDLLVELEKPIGWKFFTLELYLGQVFDRKIDLVTKNALKQQLRDDILGNVIYV